MWALRSDHLALDRALEGQRSAPAHEGGVIQRSGRQANEPQHRRRGSQRADPDASNAQVADPVCGWVGDLKASVFEPAFDPGFDRASHATTIADGDMGFESSAQIVVGIGHLEAPELFAELGLHALVTVLVVVHANLHLFALVEATDR
jgi:hypothetical protein